MSFKNILVAVDDSPQAGAALDLAIELSKALHASLTIVHAIDPSLVAMSAGDAAAALPMELEMDELQTAGKGLLKAAVARAKGAGLDAMSMLRDGPPAPTILDTARRSDADLIVLGTHGRHGVKRVLLGSCAEAVLRDAGVPVVVKRS